MLFLERRLLSDLPVTYQLLKLVPILAFMLDSKAMYTAHSFVFDLDGRICVTHETLSQQIEAMPNVRRFGHHVKLVIRQLLAIDRCFVNLPVTATYAVLDETVS